MPAACCPVARLEQERYCREGTFSCDQGIDATCLSEVGTEAMVNEYCERVQSQPSMCLDRGRDLGSGSILQPPSIVVLSIHTMCTGGFRILAAADASRKLNSLGKRNLRSRVSQLLSPVN